MGKSPKSNRNLEEFYYWKHTWSPGRCVVRLLPYPANLKTSKYEKKNGPAQQKNLNCILWKIMTDFWKFQWFYGFWQYSIPLQRKNGLQQEENSWFCAPEVWKKFFGAPRNYSLPFPPEYCPPPKHWINHLILCRPMNPYVTEKPSLLSRSNSDTGCVIVLVRHYRLWLSL